MTEVQGESPGDTTPGSETMEQSPTRYRIGTVSRITGIPVDTLRVWERRYAVVKPVRGKQSSRLYSRDDINRLSTIRMLVENGDAIGSIAYLPNETLQDRLHALENVTGEGQQFQGHSLRVCVYGQVIPLKLKRMTRREPGVDVSGLYHDLAQFESVIQSEPVDVMVIEYPAIHEDNADEIRRIIRKSGVQHAIIIYGFSSSDILDSLQDVTRQVCLLQAPVSLDTLFREIRKNRSYPDIPTGTPDDGIPPRRFGITELVDITQASNVVKCECPQHLANIILQLTQFETYSALCENRDARDARLHARLRLMTARARNVMESALQEVIEAEGIVVRKS